MKDVVWRKSFGNPDQYHRMTQLSLGPVTPRPLDTETPGDTGELSEECGVPVWCIPCCITTCILPHVSHVSPGWCIAAHILTWPPCGVECHSLPPPMLHCPCVLCNVNNGPGDIGQSSRVRGVWTWWGLLSLLSPPDLDLVLFLLLHFWQRHNASTGPGSDTSNCWGKHLHVQWPLSAGLPRYLTIMIPDFLPVTAHTIPNLKHAKLEAEGGLRQWVGFNIYAPIKRK